MPNTPTPEDPDDEDLIAYLDGELDDTTAEAVESELANNPTARTRAEEYKKSYDLLDYLPRPEPSPNFTARTLTRLQPAAGVSGSQVQPAARPSKWPEVVAWCLLAAVVAVAGFAGHYGWRQATAGQQGTELPLSDLAVIENLPLYAGVDDIEFLRELAAADLFDAEPRAVEFPRHDSLSPTDRQALIEQFRSFPPARQQQLRTLHQALKDPATEDRTDLLRSLETYAVWLARLPDADRERVLAVSRDERLDTVRQVREKRWRDALTPKQKEALLHVSGPEERQDLLQLFRSQETARRQEWGFAQRQWMELSGKDRPWPFNDPELSRQVDEFVQSAFGVDPTALPTTDREKKGDRIELRTECRLTREEVLELRNRREAALQNGYWFTYGALLLRLSEQHPTLPRPRVGEPIVRPQQLPKRYLPLKETTLRNRGVIGKWPDFAEEVARTHKDMKEPKFDPLGPCRPDEFSDSVKQFATVTLPAVLSEREKQVLTRQEGRWPEYPREMLRLAREKNLSVPEVTLPGEPEKWQQYYQLSPIKE